MLPLELQTPNLGGTQSGNGSKKLINAELQPIDFAEIGFVEVLTSLGVVAAGLVVGWLVYYSMHKIGELTERSSFRFDGILIRACAPPAGVLVGLLSLHYSLYRIPEIRRAFDRWSGIREAFIVLTITWIAASLVKNVLKHYVLPYAEKTRTDVDERFVRVLDLIAVYIIWIAGGLIALKSIGIEITAFLASMGIVGLAVALAAKTVLSNVLAGVTLTADPNIEEGNRVQVLGYLGDVVRINVHKTVLRTRDNLLVSIPNDVLAKEVVVNWELPNSRTRLELEVGVAYDTDIEEATGIIEEILDEEADLLADDREPEVNLNSFGDSAIILQIYVWLTQPRGGRHVRDDIYRKILKRFREQGIEIPFPQRVLHQTGDGRRESE
jgi:MscS family membrane protein